MNRQPILDDLQFSRAISAGKSRTALNLVKTCKQGKVNLWRDGELYAILDGRLYGYHY